jgi:hypothetical protein
MQLLSSRVASSVKGAFSAHSNLHSAKNHNNATKMLRMPRRWVFMGDSTMKHMTSKSSSLFSMLKPGALSVKNDYSCQFFRFAGFPFLLQHTVSSNNTNHSWIPPNVSRGEGPCVRGLMNHGLTDCASCDSTYTTCASGSNNNSSSSSSLLQVPLHGGFFPVEFALDVEAQNEKYSTTQENMAAFLKDMYNTPVLMKESGGNLFVS